MATSTTTSLPFANAATAVQTFPVAGHKRRSINPRAGHALEILGHAIEYLTDEFIHEGGTFSPDNGQLQAVQLLMAVNRQIYFECPEVPPIGRRLASFLGIHSS